MSISHVDKYKMITALRFMSLATDTFDEISGEEFVAWFDRQCVDGGKILGNFMTKTIDAVVRYENATNNLSNGNARWLAKIDAAVKAPKRTKQAKVKS